MKMMMMMMCNLQIDGKSPHYFSKWFDLNWKLLHITTVVISIYSFFLSCFFLPHIFIENKFNRFLKKSSEEDYNSIFMSLSHNHHHYYDRLSDERFIHSLPRRRRDGLAIILKHRILSYVWAYQFMMLLTNCKFFRFQSRAVFLIKYFNFML